MSTTNVFILPRVGRVPATGGISRVIDAQTKYLPDYDVNVVQTPEQADVLAMHATAWVKPQPNQKVIAHCHGMYWHEYNWEKWSHAVNREVIDTMRQADLITAPSEWVANIIRRGMWAHNVSVVNHGINLDEWNVVEHKGYILWDKTRIDPVCDPRPVNVLANSLPNVKFVSSFGDVSSNVEIIGMLGYEEHKPLLQGAMLYLCTARETFGIGTLEALASGIPIVGWNWAGQSEFITRDKNVGWLSPVGNYDDLKRGIEYCIANRQELSRNARSLAEQFTWPKMIEQYADMYKAVDINNISNIGKPHVSVIMPSYNLREYLQQAIKSVLEQDYTDFELIVVDDCSTDGSYLQAKQWETADKRVKVIRTPHNLYLSSALNYGIEHSQGDYLLPLDADNYIAPGTLHTLADSLDQDRLIDIAYGRVKFVKEDGSPDSDVSGDGISLWPPSVFSYEQQLTHHNSIPSTSMYRRKVFDRVGGYRRRCKTAEDADFWCRAVTFGAKPQKVTNAVTLVYRNRSDSMSHIEQDWGWHEWYQYQLQPFAVQNSSLTQVHVPTYEPLAISVIIPVGPGHGDQGITDALDSLYAQTFLNWECIVVDDTDDGNGSEIRWLPSWIHKLTTGIKGKGSSVARNLGIAAARGQCFVLLDADDFLDPHCLEKMWTAWQQDRNSYVYSDWYRGEEVIKVNAITPEHILQGIPHPITCLYPIDVRDKVKFDESMQYGEDWDYILQVVASSVCPIYVPDPLVYYRQTSGGNRNGLKENREQIQQLLETRWSDKIMGCGCGGAKTHLVTSPSSGGGISMQASGGSSDLVLIEFTKPMMAPLTYIGKSTGTEYRFGSDDNHKFRYIHRPDVQGFLDRSHEFRIANTSNVADQQPVGV